MIVSLYIMAAATESMDAAVTVVWSELGGIFMLKKDKEL